MMAAEFLKDNKDIKSVYVSGPITDHPHGNKEAFMAAAEKVRELGLHVINPSELDEAEQVLTEELCKIASGGAEWAKLLIRDILHVTAADAIVAIQGWQTSRGAKLEILIASSLNKPVYYVDDLKLIPEDELPQSEKEGSVLQSAIMKTGPETIARYGHPQEAFTRDAQIVSGLLGKEILPSEIPLIMAGLKLSRYAHDPKRGRNSLIDAAGYIGTIDLLAEKAGGWSRLKPDEEPEAPSEES